MKILGFTKNEITENKYCENVHHLENNEVVLVYCNIVNNNYWNDSKVLHTFIPNKSFGQLLDISLIHFKL